MCAYYLNSGWVHSDARKLADGLAGYIDYLLHVYRGERPNSPPEYLLHAQDMLGRFSARYLGDRDRLLDAVIDCAHRDHPAAA